MKTCYSLDAVRSGNPGLPEMIGHHGTSPDKALGPLSGQTCAAPPSTYSSAPVMKLASEDARNATALAISSGRPRRPIVTVEARASMSYDCEGLVEQWVSMVPD